MATGKPVAVEKTYMLYPDDVLCVETLAADRFEGRQSMAVRHIIRHYQGCADHNGNGTHPHYTPVVQDPEKADPA